MNLLTKIKEVTTSTSVLKCKIWLHKLGSEKRRLKLEKEIEKLINNRNIDQEKKQKIIEAYKGEKI